MPESCILCHGSSFRLKLYTSDLLFSQHQDVYPIFECRGCGLLCTSLPGNQPPPRYPQDYYHRIATHGGKRATRPGRIFAERLKSLNRFTAGGRILDVGCGDGCFLSVLQSAGWEAVGSEIDDAIVHSLRRQGLEVHGGKLPGLQLPKGSFDVITYFGSFEHVDQPLEELEAAKRILDKDGLLLLYVTNAGSLEARAFGRNWMGYEAPRHRFNYTPKTLRLMLKIKGFQVLAMDIRNDDFITSFSLACTLGLRSRYSTLEKPLKWVFRPMHYITRRFSQGNVFEVAARVVA